MNRRASRMQRANAAAYSGGFTLIEVLVALMIVALGMGAVLSALSSSAFNVSALRDKTLAQWIALNQIADTRLSLQVPASGTTQGDIRNFGNGDWHWQQDVIALTQIPGLLQITVSVRRNTPGTPATKTATTTSGNATAPNWLASVVGFRGNGLAPASGEVPDWGGAAFAASNPGNTSGNTGGNTTGNVGNPGTATSPAAPATTPANPPSTGIP